MNDDTRREIEFMVRFVLRRHIDRDIVLIIADVARDFGHDETVLLHAHDYVRRLRLSTNPQETS